MALMKLLAKEQHIEHPNFSIGSSPSLVLQPGQVLDDTRWTLCHFGGGAPLDVAIDENLKDRFVTMLVVCKLCVEWESTNTTWHISVHHVKNKVSAHKKCEVKHNGDMGMGHLNGEAFYD